MTGFQENAQKPQFLTLNPRIMIFFKIPAVSLSLLYWHLTSCKDSEKTNEQFPRYSKTDEPLTEKNNIFKYPCKTIWSI